jgi:hypothetical protein
MQTNRVRGGNDLRWGWAIAAWGLALTVPWIAFGADRMVLCEEFTATS